MPSPTVDQDLVDFAVDAARQAGTLTLEWYQQRDLNVERKGDGSPVTQADKAAEQLVRELITRRFPDDSILGEEHGARSGTTDRLWVIDPIDGTKAFTHGVPLFSNLIALVDEHGPAVGVINLPALDECVWAGRGRGALWNGEPCGVSSGNAIAESYVCTSGFSAWSEQSLHRALASGCRLRTWGDAYGYALVATGRAEAMIDPIAYEWDLAPVSVIISEAGGMFTDTGGANAWDTGSGLGSNGSVHGAALDWFA